MDKDAKISLTLMPLTIIAVFQVISKRIEEDGLEYTLDRMRTITKRAPEMDSHLAEDCFKLAEEFNKCP